MIRQMMLRHKKDNCLTRAHLTSYKCVQIAAKVFYFIVFIFLVLTMMGIQIANIDRDHDWTKYSDFPHHCTTDVGCTRITLVNSNRGGDWEPLTILRKDKDEAKDYLDDYDQTYIVIDHDDFLSYRTVSIGWGFIDDTIIRFDFCTIGG
jgi:hypothetical protein